MLRVHRNEVEQATLKSWSKVQEMVQSVVNLESELGFDVLVEEAEGEDGEGGVAKIVH